MLPYNRSFDHDTYFKWGVVYFMDMIQLKGKTPDIGILK